MTALIAFLVSHWPALSGVFVGVAGTALATIKNRLPKKDRPIYLDVLIDLLAWQAKPGMRGIAGRMSIPFVPSRHPRRRAGASGSLPTKPTRLVMIFASSALVLSGCAAVRAWTKCELGQLPAIAQAVIPAIVQILSLDDNTSAMSGLEALAKKLGPQLAPGQFSCLVQAVSAQDPAAEAAPITRAQLSPRTMNLKRNAASYLDKYPADCCHKADAGPPPMGVWL